MTQSLQPGITPLFHTTPLHLQFLSVRVRVKFESSYNWSMVVEGPVANTSGAENKNKENQRMEKRLISERRGRPL